MDFRMIIVVAILFFVSGALLTLVGLSKKEPACPDNLPIRVYDLERKTLTCFPPPLLYGQGRKELKKEI